MLGDLATALLAPLRNAGNDIVRDAGERFVVALLALVAAVFALAAATLWLALRHGALAACTVMAAVFAALALVAWLARLARSRASRRRRRLETERLRATLSNVAQTAAVAADLGAAARKVNPWLLVGAALLAGYAGTRSRR